MQDSNSQQHGYAPYDENWKNWVDPQSYTPSSYSTQPQYSFPDSSTAEPYGSYQDTDVGGQSYMSGSQAYSDFDPYAAGFSYPAYTAAYPALGGSAPQPTYPTYSTEMPSLEINDHVPYIHTNAGPSILPTVTSAPSSMQTIPQGWHTYTTSVAGGDFPCEDAEYLQVPNVDEADSAAPQSGRRGRGPAGRGSSVSGERSRSRSSGGVQKKSRPSCGGRNSSRLAQTKKRVQRLVDDVTKLRGQVASKEGISVDDPSTQDLETDPTDVIVYPEVSRILPVHPLAQGEAKRDFSWKDKSISMISQA
ncbi:uncharacterized protein I303_107997 [Kwoniella dejecticola CBS 10117]|uniref:Uncharacterized protein n=1 Tax=Kwoniella dejecticola CBS 10117 TaxID=1296121 RepID=A0A1A5ZW95_9TREE|nr:uncharacterized protein I303_07988 [Kwoniella dejecticola CBS 10117]OBR82074.1 hypothetical protein I303_07988 [Kwoniella dejecticola CBS 10117]